ncbi:uncharacterized protein TRAVEDRAFT_52159 [Trametes versicolor FP-101664 SS1]|uniref:uncharacterized protein n=1 Tax=Trametes versicolor (strain FP-101664) TaxID=717944 RepID=UPI00046216CB|nr:uncharacterized protein TRAVEDRAFT_52159 [Trametes versicolor FP-101664 SS1]EIW54453.1 hypothetical protein TRAVEDRAFT_52159 [Trametes versicolor FP-101664 SS1]
MPSQDPSDVSLVDGQNADGSKRSSVLDELADRSMRNIAAELSILRQDNALLRQDSQRLKKLVEEMSLEMALLRKENTAFKGASRYFIEENKGRRLILVCKWWSGRATELFYEDIALRRMGQILALADVLAVNQAARKNLAQLIKSIRLDACVILGPCADVAREALQSIFTLCTALQTFEYHPAKNFCTAITPPPEDDSGVFNPAWFVDSTFGSFQVAFQERVAGLVVLDIAMPFTHKQVAHLHELLSVAVRLETLKLGPVQDTEAEEDYLGPLRVVQLPQLKELYVPNDEARFVRYLSRTWEMPLLERLTTRHASSIPSTLLAAHGRRLLYLHVYPSKIESAAAGVDFKRLTELCPLLEHLVLPRLVHHNHWRAPHALRVPLGALRFLPTDLLHVDLPAICDPRTPLGDEAGRKVYFPGMRASWSKHRILHDRGLYAGDDEPGDYYVESEESDSNSENSDDEDSSIGPDTDESENLSTEEDMNDIEEEEGDDADNVKSEDGDGSEPEGNGGGEAQEDGGEGVRESGEREEDISENESDYWQPDEQLDRDTVLEMFMASRDGD